MPNDVALIVLLFTLFVVPRFLQRYRLPSAITSLALGAAATWLDFLSHNDTVALLSTFGIVALFLFAGLDVDVEGLRPELPQLAQHLGLWVLMLALVSALVAWLTPIPPRYAALVGLGLLTPSTGFILDSLDLFGLSPEEKAWVKSGAIALELLALLVMFVALQSVTLRQLGISSAILVALVVVLPPLFRWFAERIAPYAPRSEFAFLLMVAVLAASVTRRLGVYYLVGAFVVGLAARQFRNRLPAMSSERMLGAVEAFASFFVPFYFFKAGQGLTRSELDLEAVLLGLGFLVGGVALRLGTVVLHRQITLKERLKDGLRPGVAMLPTLVFTLVIADLLRPVPAVPRSIIGALLIYTTVITLLPGFLLRVRAVEYGLPHLYPLTAEEAAAEARDAASSGVPARIRP